MLSLPFPPILQQSPSSICLSVLFLILGIECCVGQSRSVSPELMFRGTGRGKEKNRQMSKIISDRGSARTTKQARTDIILVSLHRQGSSNKVTLK